MESNILIFFFCEKYTKLLVIDYMDHINKWYHPQQFMISLKDYELSLGCDFQNIKLTLCYILQI